MHAIDHQPSNFFPGVETVCSYVFKMAERSAVGQCCESRCLVLGGFVIESYLDGVGVPLLGEVDI